MSKKKYQSPEIEVKVFESDSVTNLALSGVQGSYTKISKSKIGNSNAIDF